MPSPDRPQQSTDESDGPSAATASFTTIDLETIEDRRWQQDAPTYGLMLALLGLGVAFAYDYVVAPGELVAVLDWDLTRVDWLTVLAGLLLVRYGVVPLVVNRRRGARLLRRFLRRPAGVLSLSYLLVFAGAGIAGPDAFFSLEYPRLMYKFQPPAFTTVDSGIFPYYNCFGALSDESCRGTFQYPLGTNRFGQNMLRLIMHGMRIGLQLGLSAGMIMVVFATAVGTTAGYFGGWLDDVLMSYVDLQRAVPAIVVYLILATVFLGDFENVADGSMFELILVFGILNWGGMARLVRSNVLGQRSEGYVLAAKSAGASNLRILRYHVVPNVKTTIVTSLTRRIPLLILAQVALAYLGFNRVDNRSLGRALRFAHVGNQSQTIHMAEPPQIPWHEKWWVSVFPVLFLACTVLAFNFLGDVLRDLNDVQRK